MTDERMVARRFLMFLLFPSIPWICLRFADRSATFPIQDIEQAFLVFPKLKLEYAILLESYPQDLAARYVFSYANTFFLTLSLFAIVTVFHAFSWFMSAVQLRSSASLPSGADIKITKQSVENQKGSFLGVLAIVVILTYVAFWVPIISGPWNAYYEKQIQAMYTVFMGLFGFVFFFGYGLFLFPREQILREITFSYFKGK